MSTEAAPRARQWRVLAAILLVTLGASKAISWWTQESTAAQVRQQVKPGDITMYATETCPYCAKARAWMTQHGIPWQECDVEHNAVCKQTFEAQGAPGTPLMQVKGRWNLGFNPEWLRRAIEMPPLNSGKTAPT
jgi:glutaredoxin